MEILRIICFPQKFDIELRTRSSVVAGSGGFGRSGCFDCGIGKDGFVVIAAADVVVGVGVVFVYRGDISVDSGCSTG